MWSMSRKKHEDLSLLHLPVETKDKKPVAVVDYNQGKSRIDLSDQYTAVQTSLRKEIKWYCKLAFEILLGMALVNLYLVFRSVSQRKIDLRQFKKELVEKMLNLPKPQQHPRLQGLKQIKHQTQEEDILGVIRNLSNKKEETLLLKKLGR